MKLQFIIIIQPSIDLEPSLYITFLQKKFFALIMKRGHESTVSHHMYAQCLPHITSYVECYQNAPHCNYSFLTDGFCCVSYMTVFNNDVIIIIIIMAT